MSIYYGTAAVDTLVGGSSSDLFIFEPGSVTTSTAAPDTIVNFAGAISFIGPAADFSNYAELLAGDLGSAKAMALDEMLFNNLQYVAVKVGADVALFSKLSGVSDAAVVLLAGKSLSDISSNNIAGGVAGVTIGGVGGDTLTAPGQSGGDTLIGGAGDDVLIGRASAAPNLFVGGSGDDAVSYAGLAGGVRIHLDSGYAEGALIQRDTFDSIENAVGSAYADTIYGSAQTKSIDGGAGADLVSFENSSEGVHSVQLKDVETVLGSAFNDQIRGDIAANSLAGGGGDDTLSGSGGADTLAGGAGDDFLDGDDGDVLDGGAGHDAFRLYYLGQSTIRIAVGDAGVANPEVVESFNSPHTIIFGAGPSGGYAVRTAPGYAEALAIANGLIGAGSATYVAVWVNHQYMLFADSAGDGGLAEDALVLQGALGVPTAANIQGATFTLPDDPAPTATSGNDYLQARPQDASLSGLAGDDTLIASGAGSRLDGGPGDDLIVVASSEDSVTGGDGFDTVDFSHLHANLHFMVLRDGSTGTPGLSGYMTGLEGIIGTPFDDHIFSSTGHYAIAGGAGNDSIEFWYRDATSADRFDGGDGYDTLQSGGVIDWTAATISNFEAFQFTKDEDRPTDVPRATLTAGQIVSGFSPNLKLIGSWNEDHLTILGSPGISLNLSTWSASAVDTISDLKDDITIVGSVGADTYMGSTWRDVLKGQDGADSLNGWENDDRLEGGAGADTLAGGAGNDTMQGGSGADVFIASVGADVILDFSRAEGDKVDLDGATIFETVQIGSDAVLRLSTGGQLTLAGVATSALTGGWLVGSSGSGGGSGGTGGGGGSSGGGAFEGISSSSALSIKASDSLTFGTGTATLITVGYNPDGTIAVSMNGQSMTFGGAISDVSKAGHIAMPDGSKLFIGAGGSEAFTGAATGDAAFGGLGDDTLDGGSGGDLLQGNQGRDSLVGGEGSDTVYGGQDDDTLLMGSGGNFGQGNKGVDIVAGGEGVDTLLGGQDNDTVAGDAGNDFLNGNRGDDSISGGLGNDTLYGEGGNDTLAGGSGADVFHGFAGGGLDRVVDFSRAEGDRVVLDPGATYTTTQSGADVVVAYGAGDQIVLVGVSMVTLTGDWIVA